MLMGPDEISVRLILETTDAREANLSWEALRALVVTQHWTLKSHLVRPYWKMPECFEVHCRVAPERDPDSAYDELVRALAEGWGPESTTPFSREVIWNPTSSAKFRLPRVRWAHVELIRGPRPA